MSRAFAIVLAGCWTGAPIAEPPATPRPGPSQHAISEMTPPGLDKVWLGMSLAELIAARPKAAPDPGGNEHDPYVIYEESHPSPTISYAAYWMRRRGEQRERVYQIGVTYRRAGEAQRTFETRYVPRGRRHPKGWEDEKLSEQIHIRGFEFLVGAWTYSNTLNVGAAIPDTPSEDGQFQKP